MKKRMLSALLLVLMLCCAAAAQGETAYAAVSGLPVLREAAAETQKLGSLRAGARVTVHYDGGGWARLQLGEVTGYVEADGLSAASPVGEPATGTVTSPYGTPTVVLRSRPSNSYGAAGVLETGAQVRVLGEFGGFYGVDSPAGTGFLAKDEVK